MHVQQVIRTHPHVRGSANDALMRCIEECYGCAAACTACADACLGEASVQQLTQCIRLNLDCADVCAATGAVASRRTGSNEEVIRLMLQACAAACRVCGSECESHAGHHAHCEVCAQSCRRCEQACQEALRSMARAADECSISAAAFVRPRLLSRSGAHDPALHCSPGRVFDRNRSYRNWECFMTATHRHCRRRSMHAAAAFLLLALSTSGGMAQASGPAPAVSPAIYEPEFLRMMIDHHGMAVEMAELCPGRTAHAEVLDTCTSIVATQKQEIKKMKSWLSNWYGITYEPQMMPHEMADLDRLATMNGADFEKDFLLSMTTHHMAAIQNAAECLARAYHYQLIDECEAIVTSQALEMATMRGWLARWYGIRALNFMRSAVIGPANRPHG